MCYASSCAKKLPSRQAVIYPNYHKKELGASAKDLLSNDRFTSLTVEIQYMPGFRPQPETLDTLHSFLTSHLKKSDGIKIVISELKNVKKKMLTKDEVVAIEDAARSLLPADKNLTLYMLFTDGSHPDKNILGMAYRNTSTVIFGKSVAKHSGNNKLLTKSELETSVVFHEIGHLLGLGNPQAAALNSKSATSRNGHCDNKSCLMYWATETRNPTVISRRGKIPQFGRECLETIEGMRGRRDLEYPDEPTSFISGF
ncbi:MAG TPA: hypothetical protein VD996_03255 [Chitinophagaceae bacterium]|nr:hypothetical protein [Chitinophagaceae bacterium]